MHAPPWFISLPLPLMATQDLNCTTHDPWVTASEPEHCAFGLISRAGWAVVDESRSPVLDPAAGVGGWVRPQLSGGCPALTVSWRACACVSLYASELACACNKKSLFSLFVSHSRHKKKKLLRAVMKSTVRSHAL
jgi:hypothetical protein